MSDDRLLYNALQEIDRLRAENEKLQIAIAQIKIEAATEISFQREQVEKLRQLNCNLIRKDECDELRAENETHKEIAVRETMKVATLRAALKPFAEYSSDFDDEDEAVSPFIRVKHLRAAAAALKETNNA